MEAKNKEREREPAIIQCGLQLLALTHDLADKFPRRASHHLGQHFTASVDEVVERLVTINARKDLAARVSMLKELEPKLKMIGLRTRLAYDKKLMDSKGLAEMTVRLNDLGGQLSRWLAWHHNQLGQEK